MINNILENLIKEVKTLKNEGDNMGFQIDNEIGLFIEIEEGEDGKEYFIEVNNIDNDGCFEPIGETFSVEFGKFEEVKEIAKGIFKI